MDHLRDFLAQPSRIVSKSLPQVNKYVIESAQEDAEKTIDLLSRFFCGNDAVVVVQAFCLHTVNVFRKNGFFEQFKEKCLSVLSGSFWNNDQPSFFEITNAIMLFGEKDVLEGKAIEFANLISKVLGNLEPKSLFYASKTIEDFYGIRLEHVKIEGRSDILFENSNSHSAIASSILKSINRTKSFDTIFSLLRSLSIAFECLFDFDAIDSLYINNNSRIAEVLLSQISKMDFYLLLSILARKNYKNSQLVYTFVKQLLGEGTSPASRLYGYNSLLQILPFIYNNRDFFEDFTQCLLRDYDSTNNILSTAVKSLYSSLYKLHKDNLGVFCNDIYRIIEPLSWHSKLKNSLMPQILPYIPEGSFPMIEMFEHAQDLADSAFVQKSVKSFITSGERCEFIISHCLMKLMNCMISSDLPKVHPLFGPIFEKYPQFVGFVIDQIKDKQFYIKVWVTYEIMSLIPKNMWTFKEDDVFMMIKYGLISGNWDLKCGAFQIYYISGMPKKNEEISLLIENFENLLYIDSPKHMVSVTSTVLAMCENYFKSTKSFDQTLVKQLLKQMLRISTKHLSPAFVTGHKQFALDISSSIIKFFPELQDEYHLIGITTLLRDSSIFSYASRELKSRSHHSIVHNFIESHSIRSILSSVSTKDSITTNHCCIISNELELLCVLNEIKQTIIPEKLLELCRLVSGTIKRLSSTLSDEIIELSAEAFYEMMIQTRNLGVAIEGQHLIEGIAALLSKDSLLRLTSKWAINILGLMKGFDTENFRRGAALPYLVLTIIRLHPPQFQIGDISIFDQLINELLVIAETTENNLEAINSFNVIRAVLTDKITSTLLDTFLSRVYVLCFDIQMRLSGWELSTAAILCLAAIMKKILKKSSQKTQQHIVSLDQLLIKLSGAREIMIKSIKSKNNISVYLVLNTLCHFQALVSDIEFLSLIIEFIKHKDVRIRKEAVHACVAVISRDNYVWLIDECVKALNKESNEIGITIDSYNALHGIIMLLDRLISSEVRPTINIIINLAKIPTPIQPDAISLLNKLHNSITMPITNSSGFDYYHARVLCFEEKIPENTSDKILVSMLLQNSQNYPSNLVDVIYHKLFGEKECSNALQVAGFAYLSQNVGRILINKDRIINLLINEKRPFIVSYLHKILCSMNTSPQEFEPIISSLYSFAFQLGEDITPVHITSASLLPKFLSLPLGKAIALRLLIDEVPLVRTLAMSAVSGFYGVDFLCENELLSRLIESLKNENGILMMLCRTWINLIKERSSFDIHGEQLTYFVDEFFIVRTILSSLGYNVSLPHTIDTDLPSLRDHLIEQTRSIII